MSEIFAFWSIHFALHTIQVIFSCNFNISSFNFIQLNLCTPQSSFLSSNQLLNICNLVPKFWNYSFSPFFGNSTYFDQNPSKLQYIYNNQYLNKLISNPFNLTPKYSFLMVQICVEITPVTTSNDIQFNAFDINVEYNFSIII